MTSTVTKENIQAGENFCFIIVTLGASIWLKWIGIRWIGVCNKNWSENHRTKDVSESCKPDLLKQCGRGRRAGCRGCVAWERNFKPHSNQTDETATNQDWFTSPQARSASRVKGMVRCCFWSSRFFWSKTMFLKTAGKNSDPTWSSQTCFCIPKRPHNLNQTEQTGGPL